LLFIKTSRKRHKLGECGLYGGPVLLSVIVSDDLLILPVIVHPERVSGEHLCKLCLNDFSDVLQGGMLTSDFLGKLIL
jgi:hypothetical protein